MSKPQITESASPLGHLSSSSGAALRRSFERAEVSKIELLKSPDMVSGEDLARELGVSRATVDNRRVAGKLLALEFGSKRGFRFPRWQRDLIVDREVRTAFEAVLERLSGAGQWSRYRFFTQNSAELEGRTPFDALLARDTDAVLGAAISWTEGTQGGG